MASKKAGRLAGLAALAGLAYMNKDKLFGAKGETKAAETKAETKVKDTAAEDAKAAAKRDADEETMGYTSSGNAAMYEKEPGFETKTTPAKVASASSPASKPAQTGRFAPSGSPVLSDNPRKIGNAKAVVAQGGNRSARSDMVSAGPNPVRAPGGVGKRGGVGDGGQSMVERQNAGAKRAGLSVDDYLTSGKKTIDEQDGTFKRGGKVKKMASGGMTSSASKRADGIASKGKTRGRMC
jgi:hypothetical protein